MDKKTTTPFYYLQFQDREEEKQRQLEKLKLDLRGAPITVSAFSRRGQSVIFRSGSAFVYDSETFKKIWSDDPDDLSIQVTISSNLNVVLVSPYSKLMICHDAVKESHDISRSKTASISLKKDHREILKMLTRVHGMGFGLGYLCESSGMTISFTIWDDVASKFGMEAYGLMEKPVVIAASSCWVTSKYGGLQLTATTATHYSLNPNIPEVETYHM
ncbi:nucleic acid-binding, OB-fold protein [Tanacetum coccineum]